MWGGKICKPEIRAERAIQGEYRWGEKRWGRNGADIPADSIAWEIEAFYLAQAIVNYILILSPEKIILGGGVMKQRQLFPKIRQMVMHELNGYLHKPQLLSLIDSYIVPPALRDNAGICGAVALAMDEEKKY